MHFINIGYLLAADLKSNLETDTWSFFYNSFVKFHGKNNLGATT